MCRGRAAAGQSSQRLVSGKEIRQTRRARCYAEPGACTTRAPSCRERGAWYETPDERMRKSPSSGHIALIQPLFRAVYRAGERSPDRIVFLGIRLF